MEKQPFFRAATAGLRTYRTGGYGRIGVQIFEYVPHSPSEGSLSQFILFRSWLSYVEILKNDFFPTIIYVLCHTKSTKA